MSCSTTFFTILVVTAWGLTCFYQILRITHFFHKTPTFITITMQVVATFGGLCGFAFEHLSVVIVIPNEPDRLYFIILALEKIQCVVKMNAADPEKEPVHLNPWQRWDKCWHYFFFESQSFTFFWPKLEVLLCERNDLNILIFCEMLTTELTYVRE